MTYRNTCSLFLALSLFTFNANSQHLFGNPSCSEWEKLAPTEKTTWLHAFLVPLNLTNVARKKPKIDHFSQLTSLDPALDHVNNYCKDNTLAQASVGAIQFLDELTK